MLMNLQNFYSALAMMSLREILLYRTNPDRLQQERQKNEVHVQHIYEAPGAPPWNANWLSKGYLQKARDKPQRNWKADSCSRLEMQKEADKEVNVYLVAKSITNPDCMSHTIMRSIRVSWLSNQAKVRVTSGQTRYFVEVLASQSTIHRSERLMSKRRSCSLT